MTKYATRLGCLGDILGTLSKPRRQRLREQDKAIFLMRGLMDLHVHYKKF